MPKNYALLHVLNSGYLFRRPLGKKSRRPYVSPLHMYAGYLALPAVLVRVGALVQTISILMGLGFGASSFLPLCLTYFLVSGWVAILTFGILCALSLASVLFGLSTFFIDVSFSTLQKLRQLVRFL
eukprot:SM000280S10714  [mRNA]  locus=s280:20930:21734:+ [translate_table: standard]